MAKKTPKNGSRDAQVLKLRSTQEKLHEALSLLFELLELYSPIWYDKCFHDQAKVALKLVERTARQVHSKIKVC
jgi:hypothetical protein